jgi:hypothetical protein
MKSFAMLVVLILFASLSSAQFKPGDVVKVSADAEDCLNAREEPKIPSVKIHCETVGSTGVILAGPTTANGYTWYQVKYADGHIGWSAGELLELVSLPPVFLPPTGSLSVSKIVNGKATAWYTMKGESTAVVSGYPKDGEVSGTLTFPALRDTAIELRLRGPGGETMYTAWTASGSTPPAAPDSAKIAQAAYSVGYVRGFSDGKASVICPPVNAMADSLYRLIEPFFRLGH